MCSCDTANQGKQILYVNVTAPLHFICKTELLCNITMVLYRNLIWPFFCKLRHFVKETYMWLSLFSFDPSTLLRLVCDIQNCIKYCVKYDVIFNFVLAWYFCILCLSRAITPSVFRVKNRASEPYFVLPAAQIKSNQI